MKQTVTLGSTNITVNKNGFGALPIQRISTEDAVYLLHKKGVYDTAGIKCNLFPEKCLLFQMGCCPLSI